MIENGSYRKKRIAFSCVIALISASERSVASNSAIIFSGASGQLASECG